MKEIEKLTTLLGLPVDTDVDDVLGDGIYFRTQPVGLGINGHRSTTSNDEMSDGLHVHQTLGQAIFADHNGDDVELIVIRWDGEDWPTDDYEGVNIDPDTAEIIGRFDFEKICDEYEEEQN